MMPIRFEEPSHSTGERLFVPTFAMRQALGWWVVAEMIRRHPEQLRVVEAHPHQYGMALTLMRQEPGHEGWQFAAFLTLGENFHITPSGDWSNGRFNWLDVLLAPNRRSYVVEQLKANLGLPAVRGTPPTASGSVGPRAIASYLARSALGPELWVVQGGAYADDDDSGWRPEYFRCFPGIADAPGFSQPSKDVYQMACSRYWFLTPVVVPNEETGDPVVAIDVVSGRYGNAHENGTSLMDLYHRMGRKIDAVASHVFPPAH